MLSPAQHKKNQRQQALDRIKLGKDSAIRNAHEVSRSIQEKKNAQVHHFNKVLELCFRSISQSADMNCTHCIFEVPEFLIGHPLYDINECIVYILRKLQEQEYQVSYYFPRTIYIVWQLEENEDEKINTKLLEVLNSIQIRHQHLQFLQQNQDHNNITLHQNMFSSIPQNTQYNQYNQSTINNSFQTPYLSPHKMSQIQQWNDLDAFPNQYESQNITNNNYKTVTRHPVINRQRNISPKKDRDQNNESNNNPFFTKIMPINKQIKSNDVIKEVNTIPLLPNDNNKHKENDLNFDKNKSLDNLSHLTNHQNKGIIKEENNSKSEYTIDNSINHSIEKSITKQENNTNNNEIKEEDTQINKDNLPNITETSYLDSLRQMNTQEIKKKYTPRPRGKKKVVKPISELKNNNKFVLDLS